MVKEIVLDRGACFALALAAIEVFPRECMGGLFSKDGIIRVIFPYQLARRRKDAVESWSSSTFRRTKFCGWTKVGDFHSHPYVGFVPPLEPSRQDIKQVYKDEAEVIIRIFKAKRKENRLRFTNKQVTIHVGRFRCSIKAFIRTSPRGFKYEELPIRIKND